MGSLIADKYFKNYGGISIQDSYPTFREIASFKVSNPFTTGTYIDQMVYKASENNINALIVRSYFDHIILYLAGLKNKSKAGLPFEISYGVFQEIFAVLSHPFLAG